MKYTITWTRAKKKVVLRSFAGMVLWVSDPKWEWALGRSVDRIINWIEAPSSKIWSHKCGPMRWKVEE